MREGSFPFGTGLGGGRPSRIQIGNIDVSNFAYGWYLRNASDQHAALLKYASAVVESAKLPVEEQLPQLNQLADAIVKQPFLVRMLAPANNKFAGMIVRTKAGLRVPSWPRHWSAIVERIPAGPTH